jgi:hypothetical protein
MQKTSLNLNQINDLVLDNRYKVNEKSRFISRCIDGRYQNDENLPALAFPGAEAGELALILATARAFAFKVNPELAYKSLVEVVGGEKNLHFHTDNHHDGIIAGCGHITQETKTPQDYNLTEDEINFVKEKSKQAIKNGAIEIILEGDHKEAAVVYISGDYGVYPQGVVETDGGSEIPAQIFIYHQTLVNERHRELAKKLIENKAVVLPEGTGEEYLYEALSDTSDTHLLETLKRLAKGLPIYQVNFEDDGGFKIEEMGMV